MQESGLAIPIITTTLNSIDLPEVPSVEMLYAERLAGLTRPLHILLLKPFQPMDALLHSPPLGLLYLVALLRERFGNKITIEFLDMKLHHHDPAWISHQLHAGKMQADVVGLSALNFEARVAKDIATAFKQHNPQTITVLGGPYALHRSQELLQETDFDWIFSGAADITFPEAISRLLEGKGFSNDITGMSYKRADGSLHIDIGQANVKDLDALPLPAWDLIDFEAYAKKSNMMGMLKGKRYATLFTSRGCPYLCNYCHDIFSKKFTHRSPENVINEIALLHETYGVDEFEIVDDIFNLHKPRLKTIMGEVARRWPGKLHFCFPNGLRADILDDEVIDALKASGTYAMNIAIETVTPRLQRLIEKDLNIEKSQWAIAALNKRGMMVGGFFMLGFPTETPQEIKATIDFALQSQLTIAHFFIVVPQKETPLYDLCLKENETSLDAFTLDAENGVAISYYTAKSWYQRAYGVHLHKYLTWAIFRFYFSPTRVWLILKRVPLRSILHSAFDLAGIVKRLQEK